MNHYELLYIIPAKFTDQEVKAIAQNVQGVVRARGGQVINEDHGFGRRRLAYPIGQIRQGYYVLVNFDAETKDIPAISREVGLAENVIRHQIVKVGKFSDLKFLALQEKARIEEEETKARGMVKEREKFEDRQERMLKEIKKTSTSEEAASVPEIIETKAEESISTEADLPAQVGEPKVEESKKPAKRPAKKSAATDLAELDKKLDEILGGDF